MFGLRTTNNSAIPRHVTAGQRPAQLPEEGWADPGSHVADGCPKPPYVQDPVEPTPEVGDEFSGQGWRPPAAAGPKRATTKAAEADQSIRRPAGTAERSVLSRLIFSRLRMCRSIRIIGRVDGLTHRSEDQGWSVYAYQVISYGREGQKTGLSVEMRGKSFRGTLNDGDEVEVRGKQAADGLLQTAAVRNLTTGSTFRTFSHENILLKLLLGAPGFIVYIAFLIAFFYFAIRLASELMR